MIRLSILRHQVQWRRYHVIFWHYRALVSRWSIFVLLCFFAASDICFHISGHTLSGLEGVCFLVSLSPDHAYPSVFEHRSKRNNWAFKWYSEPFLMKCLPIRQEILYVSLTAVAFHGIRPPFHSLSRPDCNCTADVPSFTLRPALSEIPLVFDPCGVDVQWLQERSSQALPNSKELSV